jgi:2-amino-4-hydroxy-6-hydroxymethyldihydropteridine diphosphokinase
MSTVVLGLGSNLGNRLAHLRRALQAVRALPGTRILAVSALYESAPWGGIAQPPFFNSVAVISTPLAPPDLLRAVKRIERAAGRTAGRRWGPRPLDIDLLLYDDLQVDTPDLIIPHPRLTERRFVLAPLQDLLPAWRDAAGQPLPTLLAAVADQPVTQVATGAWWEAAGPLPERSPG